MCTLTWHFHPGGYEVHFNRDERRSRRSARAPTLELLGGVSVILPADGDAGGTWIAANAHGVCLTLLNGYRFMEDPDTAPPSGTRSRGRLLRDLSDCESLQTLAPRLGAVDLSLYQPFTLVAFASGAPASCFEWNGLAFDTRTLVDSDRPVCSSSRDQEGAERGRSRLLREMLTATEFPGAELSGTLARFHASHEPERGAVSVCMHREDAHTVSYSHVSVGSNQVRFDYVAGAPCSTKERGRVDLGRASARVS